MIHISKKKTVGIGKLSVIGRRVPGRKEMKV